MAQPIKHYLGSLLAQSDDWRLVLLREWPTFIGDLAPHVRLEKIENDTLVLSVQNACWLQELSMLAPLLLKTINKKLDQPRIKRLRFKQSGLNKKKPTHRPAPRITHDKEIHLNSKEQSALTAVRDPQLRIVLERFLHRCHQEKE